MDYRQPHINKSVETIYTSTTDNIIDDNTIKQKQNKKEEKEYNNMAQTKEGFKTCCRCNGRGFILRPAPEEYGWYKASFLGNIQSYEEVKDWEIVCYNELGVFRSGESVAFSLSAFVWSYKIEI